MSEAPAPWSDARLAIQVLAAGAGRLGGIHVRARAGPVLDRWLDHLRAALDPTRQVVRLSATTPESRLLGGLDVAASLEQGAPVSDPGLLAKADGGLMILSMAERMPPSFAAIVGTALERGEIVSEGHGVSRRDSARFEVIALDEGVDDERVPAALADRLGLTVDLSTVSWAQARLDAAGARQDPIDMSAVDLSDEIARAIAETAQLAGSRSMRATIWLTRVARVLAGLDAAKAVNAHHVATAIRLVFGPGIIAPPEHLPEETTDDATPDTRADDSTVDDAEPTAIDIDMLRDMLVKPDAAKGIEIDGFPAPKQSRTRSAAAAGKSGAVKDRSQRGRPAGLASRSPYPGARPNVVATLRAAAPWQKMRRRNTPLSPMPPASALVIRKSDFRYVRYRHQTRSTAIFVVDASGSTAVERLGEAKGAVELLLGDCYIRRDSVAVVAFRGMEAEVVVEPTRSLVRAKRLLTGLPGGGPTPLASGLAKGAELAAHASRSSQSPLLVVLTDGNGNVALDGRIDRPAAREDTEAIARHCAMLGVPGLVIDIARRPRDAARDLATSMTADYQQLPHADARSVSALVTDYMRS